MKYPGRRFLHLAVVAVAVFWVSLSGHGAWSQATRTIKIVVAASPGGSLDFLARVLGEQIGQAEGQTVLIEDRGGAGGVIGAEAVWRTTPDGKPC